ncbi:UNVERIFIED_CONTAM: hypothetical protein FKN15_017260 [Acipenser sinensis]
MLWMRSASQGQWMEPLIQEHMSQGQRRTEDGTPDSCARESGSEEEVVTEDGTPDSCARESGSEEEVVTEDGTPDSCARESGSEEEVVTEDGTPDSCARRNIEIMRAHRVSSGRPTSSNKPRTLIFNLLCYTDRQVLLQASRKDPPRHANKTLLF